MDATTVLVLLAVLILLFLFYRKFIKPLRIFERYGIPGPKPIPVFGNILDKNLRQTPDKSLTEFNTKYGDVYGLFFGPVPVYVVCNPEIIKKVLIKEFQKFNNKFELKTNTVLDLNLESLRDDNWNHVRSVLIPSFSTSKLKQMMPLFQPSLDALTDKMAKASKENAVAEIWSWYGLFTLQAVMATAFGLDSDCQRNPNDQLAKHAKAIFRPSTLTTITMTILPFLTPIAKVFDKNYYESIAYIERIAKGVIKERKNNNSDNGQRKDMLQLMLDAGKNDPSRKLSDDEMVGQAITFLLAGYETTSNMLSFITYMLAIRPDIQDKLADTITEKFAQDDEITYEDVQEIPYLDNVIDETLRLYPAAYFGIRECGTGCKIEGYNFVKGSYFIYPIFLLHHDSRYWENPEDFNPDRFNKDEKKNIQPYTYLPFGTGPRVCIGMRLALTEIKVTLSHIMRKFRFLQAPETEVPLKLNFLATLSPTNGIKIKIAIR